MTVATRPAVRKRPGTPRSVRRLRRLQRTAVALLLAFGALVVTSLTVSFMASSRAMESLAQYQRLADARVQAIDVQQAANSWALTPTDAVRTSVTDRLTTLATTLADASAVDADRDRVVPLTGALVHYSMTLQDALNVRDQASAALLAQADAQLSKELLGPLTDATTATADRMSGELTTSWLGWSIGGFVLAAGGLAGILVALARASHRYLNPGVALALLCALASIGVLAAIAVAASNAAGGFTGGSRAELDTVATVRQQVHQARADELLAVALRGSGGTYQQRWTTATTAAKNSLGSLSRPGSSAARLSSYSNAHDQLVAATDKAQWDTAAGLATGASAKAFDTLDSTLGSVQANLRGPVTSSFQAVQDEIGLGIGGVIVLTVAGSGLAVWGVSRRIEEYR
ncbi:MAG: hypothetical protein QM582_04915 [Micropruina sp.]|uniref:hypothetical protein n=1 Tax=Micropruina sp. TaxID=2737536 RepID=UPI0039E34CB4